MSTIFTNGAVSPRLTAETLTLTTGLRSVVYLDGRMVAATAQRRNYDKYGRLHANLDAMSLMEAVQNTQIGPLAFRYLDPTAPLSNPCTVCKLPHAHPLHV